MKKKAILIATCVALPALLALALSLTVFKAEPPKKTSGEAPTKTTVEQPVKEPKVDSPAEGQESTAPTEEPKTEIPPTKPTPGTQIEKPNPGETPAIEDPDEDLDEETPSVVEDEKDRIPIASMALLTDETTGKGVISLGDYIDDVKETLDEYELAGDTTHTSFEEDESTLYYYYGDMMYLFDVEDGCLWRYESHYREAAIFETSRGLKKNDLVSKIFELYEESYFFNDFRYHPDDKSSWYLFSYTFTYEDTIFTITVGNDSGDSPENGDENTIVCEIDCESRYEE